MLDTLPAELLELLFDYLCLNDRLQLTLVCKRMYNVFWQSSVDVRKGITFILDRASAIQDLVDSRIFQMNAINEVVLDLCRIRSSPVVDLWSEWDLLAPKLISLTIKHEQPLNAVRLLKSCSRLVSLNWIYNPDSNLSKDVSPVLPEDDLDAVGLPGLRHLGICMSNTPIRMFTRFFDDFLSVATAESRLITLTISPVRQFQVLHRLVTRHPDSLKNLNISGSYISGEQLVTLGSIPDLRLLELDLSNCSPMDLESFVQFLRLQPDLLSLNIQNYPLATWDEASWPTLKNELRSHLSGLKSLTMSNGKLGHFIPKLNNLQQLITSRVPWESPLAPSLNKSSCSLRKARFGYRDVLLLHDDHLGHLRKLSLFGYGVPKMRHPNEVFARIWQHCPDLEFLDIASLTFEADSAVTMKCNNLRKLTHLKMSLHMSNGWTDSLGMLLKLPNLRKCLLRFHPGCLRSSEDFFQFSRRLAVETPFLESVSYVGAMDRSQISRLTELWPRMKASPLRTQRHP